MVLAPYPMRRPLYEVGVLRSTAYRCRKCDWYGYLIHEYNTGKIEVYETLEEAANGEEAGPPGCPPRDEDVKCPQCGAGRTDMWRDFHNHKAYRNYSLKENLNQGLVEIDGGGTHCMLVEREAFHKKGEEAGESNMPPELQEIIDVLRRELDPQQIKRYDHYLGDLPDETMSLYEEHQQGKPYFMMPKRGTEDMYWCYRARREAGFRA